MWRQQWKPDGRPCIDWVKESLKEGQIELTSWCGCHYHVWRHSVPLGPRLRDVWTGEGPPWSGFVWRSQMRKLIGGIISNCVFILRYVCLYSVCLVSLIVFTKSAVLNWMRNWAQWHISTPWLWSTVARIALAGFLKMCLKCYPSVMLQQ